MKYTLIRVHFLTMHRTLGMAYPCRLLLQRCLHRFYAGLWRPDVLEPGFILTYTIIVSCGK
jgi:hypothetical protein